MAFNCATKSGGEWNSTLISDASGQKVDDGLIQINPEDATGNFTGTHLNTGGQIKGKCRAGSGDMCTDAAPCHIEFDRKVTVGGKTSQYHYEADFKLNASGDEFETINGRYTKRLLPVRGRKRLTDDDDGIWVGTKPVT